MGIYPSLYILGVYLLILAVIAMALYAVIRFGVKHGMRAYYAEVDRARDEKSEQANR